VTLLILGVLHLGAVALVVAAPGPGLWRAGVVLLVFWSLYRAAGLHALRRLPGAVVELSLSGSNAWQLRRIGSGWVAAELTGAFVHRALVTLTLRPVHGRWPLGVVLAADAADAEVLRRLRARLLLQRPLG
jgi:hypothetical protein